jgi:hypothetical protein
MRVFINYRTVDQPVLAAAIHDNLARRFGPDRIFRDCVSMRAGADYPDEIRAALEAADVLVAVIGPGWLSAREGDVRLIDRSDDWVRFEIGRALQRRIPVIPVLLKDTPAHAQPLEVRDLPEDIGGLATKQVLEFSHLRFGADMDRLADRLIELVPARSAQAADGEAGRGAGVPTSQAANHLRDVTVSGNAVIGVNTGHVS